MYNLVEKVSRDVSLALRGEQSRGKMTNPWIVEIEGESRVLEQLELLLRSNPRMWLQRGERFFELRSPEFDSEADANAIRAKGEELIHLMSGACRLKFGLHGRIRLRGVKRLEREKPPTQFVFVDAPILDPWGKDPTASRKDGNDSSQGFLELTLDLIGSDVSEAVKKVIRMWDRDVSFRDLTAIVEVIEKDVGGTDGIAARKWATKADVTNVFRTAQSPKIVGDEARHGIQKQIPPPKPISLEGAREVTLKIIRGWLAEKSAARIGATVARR